MRGDCFIMRSSEPLPLSVILSGVKPYVDFITLSDCKGLSAVEGSRNGLRFFTHNFAILLIIAKAKIRSFLKYDLRCRPLRRSFDCAPPFSVNRNDTVNLGLRYAQDDGWGMVRGARGCGSRRVGVRSVRGCYIGKSMGVLTEVIISTALRTLL